MSLTSTMLPSLLLVVPDGLWVQISSTGRESGRSDTWVESDDDNIEDDAGESTASCIVGASEDEGDSGSLW